MPRSRLRQQIAQEAARLMRESPDMPLAAARDAAIERLTPTGVRRSEAPSDEEITLQLHSISPRTVSVDEAASADRYSRFEALLVPLENVKQHPKHHPEGDALYHSLQVFDHARDATPYDEEFLSAALLHDVGKAIDPLDHAKAAVEALRGLVSQRTAWLIEHHMLCHDIEEGRLGARTKRRLQQGEWYEDLLLLGECDRAGRQVGVEAPELNEALTYLRHLES